MDDRSREMCKQRLVRQTCIHCRSTATISMAVMMSKTHAYLERDVVVLGVDLRLLRGHALRVLGLQEVDADAVVEQPETNALHTDERRKRPVERTRLK